MSQVTRISPTLARLALLRAGDPLEKTAIVPAGGGAPPAADPGMGGGMPPDPNAGAAGAVPGGAAPGAADPMVGQIAQQVMQMTGGGAGGAGGKPGGKKAEQMILSAQIRNLMFLTAQIAEKMGIQVPPSMMVGPPADPATEQMAAQDMQTSPSTPTLNDPNAAPPMGGAAGGAPAGAAPPAPVQPMAPDQGPIGKAADFRVGAAWGQSDVDAILDRPRPGSVAARARLRLGA